MQFQPKNLNKVRLVSLLLYAIFKYFSKQHFEFGSVLLLFIEREIIFLLGSIRFNRESTYSIFQHINVFKVSGKLLNTRGNKIKARYITKNMKIYEPNSDIKTCDHTFVDTLSSNLRPDCRDLIYLRYIDPKVEENRRWNFRSIDRKRSFLITGQIFVYEEIYIVPSMQFLFHQWYLTTRAYLMYNWAVCTDTFSLVT